MDPPVRRVAVRDRDISWRACVRELRRRAQMQRCLAQTALDIGVTEARPRVGKEGVHSLRPRVGHHGVIFRQAARLAGEAREHAHDLVVYEQRAAAIAVAGARAVRRLRVDLDGVEIHDRLACGLAVRTGARRLVDAIRVGGVARAAVTEREPCARRGRRSERERRDRRRRLELHERDVVTLHVLASIRRRLDVARMNGDARDLDARAGRDLAPAKAIIVGEAGAVPGGEREVRRDERGGADDGAARDDVADRGEPRVERAADDRCAARGNVARRRCAADEGETSSEDQRTHAAA